MDMNLADKIVVVTGASRGIGLAVSQAFVAAGAFVVAGARNNSPDLGALEDAGSALFVAADLATAEGPRALVEAAAARGGVDVLVNNTGAVATRFGGILSVTDEEWDAALAVNFMSAVRTTREALPHMLARGGGAVVMIGSVNATLPEPNIVDYSATKAALASYAKSLSKEFGPKEFASTRSVPGRSRPICGSPTAGWRPVRLGQRRDRRRRRRLRLRRCTDGPLHHPGEVADLAVFLASSRSGNTTGADVRVDGGYVATL